MTIELPLPRVEALGAAAIPAARLFSMQARAEMFGARFDADAVPGDLLDMEGVYRSSNGYFVGAWVDQEMVGSIAYRAYDHRFAQLDYGEGNVVEVVRLYVRPDHRRQGLARLLFGALKQRAIERKVDVLYLHTHPFLDGAESFWRRQGFQVDDVETDPVWQTIHMSLALPCSDRP
jgi:GNAT superfamily N-acetyltransferase